MWRKIKDSSLNLIFHYDNYIILIYNLFISNILPIYRYENFKYFHRKEQNQLVDNNIDQK